MAIQEIIERRKSVRKYKSEPVDRHLLEQLQANLDKYISAFSNAKIRFQVINNYENTQKMRIGFLYGLGKINAPCCIAAICDNGEGMMEIGFALEQVVLKLTERGYATCWLGTFDKQAMANLCGLKGSEQIGIVIAVGYEEDNAFINNEFRKVTRSNKRKKLEEICINSTLADIDDRVRQIIQLSILAPSANNVHLYALKLIITEPIFIL